jgi:hypothetical protein
MMFLLIFAVLLRHLLIWDGFKLLDQLLQRR